MFGKKGSRPTAIQTLIGADAHIGGDLEFAGGCHIDGNVNGSVSGGNDKDAYLSVSHNGRVEGNVHVPRLGLSGSVEGDVYVSEKAELTSTARVNGNVHYNLIEIAAGAEINGQLIHELPSAQSQHNADPADEVDVLPIAELQGN
ncbi:MAG: bactofilin family protein [Gammaproteobacteria bacterium]